MIIESLTAFAAGSFLWETLEFLHMVHVGHKTSKVGYKGGNAIASGIQRQIEKLQDRRDPGQKQEREAKTPYDFKDINDASYQRIQQQAENYLTALGNSVAKLNNASKSFSETLLSLQKLANAVGERQFVSRLLKFKIDFKFFKDEFDQFLLSIIIPNRQRLYIADLSKNQLPNSEENGPIKRFNRYLENIKINFDGMENTKKEMVKELEQNFGLNVTTFSASRSSAAPYVEQSTSKTLPTVRPENTGLVALQKALIQLSATLQQTDAIENLNTSWEGDQNWFPLLTEQEQIEKAQRIFLHAMSAEHLLAKEKLLIAEIFLRLPVSKHELKQVAIDLSAHELADLLRRLQINKCKQMTCFLRTLTAGAELPEPDPYGLIEWLKTDRVAQSSIELFIDVLVSPFCFEHLRLESAIPKIKALLSTQAVDSLIEKYENSYWGAIREKTDSLIQLPKSFKAKILPRDCLIENQPSNAMSAAMHELVKKLITELENLTMALENSVSDLKKKFQVFNTKHTELSTAQKSQIHQKGVDRIKKFHRCIDSIDSPSNSLNRSLYNTNTINEAEKKQQVATVDDLLCVIYRGVDPNGVCLWKSNSSNPSSESNHLLYYFLQNQDASKEKARSYVFNQCEAHSILLFGNAFSFSFVNNRRLLALENTHASPDTTQELLENTLSIDVLFENPNKISLPEDSRVLDDMSPKMKQEAQTAFKQLDDYRVLALARINPAQRNKLPFLEQLKCLVKNLFYSTREVNAERLQTVRLCFEGFWVVLTAKDTHALSQALSELKNNYEDRRKGAKKINKSALYRILLKLIDGPIASIIDQLPENERIKFKVEEAKMRLEEETVSLRETLSKRDLEKAELESQLKESAAQSAQEKAEMAAQSAQEKEVLETKLKESEAQRAKDQAEFAAQRAEMAAQRAQDKVEMDEKINELWKIFLKSQQPAASPSSANADTSESSHVQFFKP